MPEDGSTGRERREPSYLSVGTVGRAVGLRGEVEVDVTSDAPERFAPGSRLLIAPDLRPLVVRSVRSRRGRTVVAFEGVTDRAGADALRGASLVVPIAEARGLAEGEYWDHDLIGCDVVTTAGGGVGRVVDVLHAPANDVLVVVGEEGERLLPMTSEVIREITPGERITIEPIPGLLED